MSAKDPPGDLRLLAEAKLTGKREQVNMPRSEGDLQKLVHELQVHQIELELQNEELRVSKEELEQSRKKYTDLYDLAPVGYLNLDPDGVIAAVNLRGAEMLGLERSTLLGMNFKVFFAPEDRKPFTTFLEGLESGNSPLGWESVLERNERGGLFVRIEAVRSAPGGEYRLAVSDITLLKAAEEERLKLETRLRQSQKVEAIGTLAGGIAHDFNNLLSIIIGYTTLSADSLPTWSEEWDNLHTVLSASARAKELVNQILAFSRKREHAPTTTDICSVVMEALEMLKSTIPKTVNIEHQLGIQPCWALVDPTEMVQVVMNLCINAFQSLESQKGTLRLRLKRVEVDRKEADRIQDIFPGQYLLLEIEDDGAGMDEETQSRIFEPYFTTKGLGNGTGLGLAVVQGIVSQSNGAITVRSTPGVGTVFSVYLPTHATVLAESAERPVALEAGGAGRILLVEDEPSLAKLEGIILRGLGYTVREITDPLLAIALFESDPAAFDLIVTDQTMPGMTGAELLVRAMAARPDIPSIMCTGYSDLIDEAGARELGVAAFIQKPFNREELGVAVAVALKLKHGASPSGLG